MSQLRDLKVDSDIVQDLELKKDRLLNVERHTGFAIFK